MAVPSRLPIRVPAGRLRFLGVVCVAVAASAGAPRGRAQTPEASSYPVDPVAAAGMTSGLPNGVTYRQAEMMQVRTSAQGAQGEASAAAMARSADQTIEERNREAALESARTNKAIKEEMRNRLKFERAAAVQEKVTANDMSTWKQNGGVRVERNVPDAFLMSLIEEEEQAAARADASGKKKRFSLFDGDDSPDEGALGFLGAIRPPRLPFLGGGDESAPAEAAGPASSVPGEPVFAPSSSPSRGSAAATAPPPAAAAPGRVPMISGAALVDGRAAVTTGEGASPRAADQPPSAPEPVSFADETPEQGRKPGLFSMFAPEPKEEPLVPESGGGGGGGGGFFGFGKKKSSAPAGGIDASLFPEGAVSQPPRGGSLSGGATTAAVAEDAATAPASTGAIVLPGQTVEKSRGFSLPKPSLSLPSLPSLPSISKSEGGGGGVSSGYFVVTSPSQFMAYGAEQMQSEIRALAAGTTVLVTKPGETWSGIRLDDGTEGVVQNKHLKPASGGGGAAGGEFATSPGR